MASILADVRPLAAIKAALPSIRHEDLEVLYSVSQLASQLLTARDHLIQHVKDPKVLPANHLLRCVAEQILRAGIEDRDESMYVGRDDRNLCRGFEHSGELRVRCG